MKSLAFTLLFLTFFSMNTLAGNGHQFILKRYSSQISFVVMDTIHGAQTTIIEYPDFLVLIEMPLIDEGGSKTKNLQEDAIGAGQFLNFLNNHFPKKPVKYILSSHWHQHSLSGVSPFIKNGTKIITTRRNWNYAVANDLIAKEQINAAGSHVIFISSDSLLLAKSENPIKVLLLDSTYSHKPTKEYLFFYLTKQEYLHGSCMAAVGAQDFNKPEGKYIYNERLIDFHRAITERKLKVSKVIRLGREHFKNGTFEPGIYAYTDVEKYILNGSSTDLVLVPFRKLTTEILTLKTDSIILSMIENGIPPNMINQFVYECIAVKQYEKAVLFARILNVYQPGNYDYIDTMGEAYYYHGDLQIAKRISNLLFKYDPNWSAGYEVWEKNKSGGF